MSLRDHGRVQSVTRCNNTGMGNSVFVLQIQSEFTGKTESYRTPANAMWVCAIDESIEGKDIRFTFHTTAKLKRCVLDDIELLPAGYLSKSRLSTELARLREARRNCHASLIGTTDAFGGK
mgnify:FL=1